MATNTVWCQIGGEHAAEGLHEAFGKVDSAAGELLLDFSSVRRLDPAALGALEQLAARAGDQSVRLVLRGVNVSVYRVLKLVKLAPRLSFLN
jgi:anti-anti-sigma regulatory factor